MLCKDTVAVDMGGVRAVFICIQPKGHKTPHICQVLDGQTVVGQIEWGEPKSQHWQPDVWLGVLKETEQSDG
jgi:hypothetical protein